MMLRARHPHTARAEGPAQMVGGRAVCSVRGGRVADTQPERGVHLEPSGPRTVFALLCNRCGRAVIYGDTAPNGADGYTVARVPLARVYRKPACTCGWTHYAQPQGELFMEEA